MEMNLSAATPVLHYNPFGKKVDGVIYQPFTSLRRNE